MARKTVRAQVKEAASKIETATVTEAEETARKNVLAQSETPAGQESTEKTQEAAAEKKTAEKKTAAKKNTEPKTTVCVQYLGKEIFEKDMVALVKKAWTAKKNKISDMKSIELYVKPEDNAVYYVVNGEFTGSIDI